MSADEYLNKKGYGIYVTRLKGHGTSPDDLATRNYMDWVITAKEGYIILKNLCKEVVLGGFSTGGGIAINLESRIMDSKAIIAIAPPMELQDFLQNLFRQ